MNKLLCQPRVALFQINSQVGQFEATLERTWCLVHRFRAELQTKMLPFPNIAVFPELALTGYRFESREQILPHCYSYKESPSYDFAKHISNLFKCYTVIGYPELASNGDLYNSAMVLDPRGELVHHYRKSFLYTGDEQWQCKEGPGFETFSLKFTGDSKVCKDLNGFWQDVEIRTSIGICMDLSPYKFEANFMDMEFATFNLDHEVELIIMPMAWLHSQSITDTNLKISELAAARKEIAETLESLHISRYGSRGTFEINIDDSQLTQPVPYEYIQSAKRFDNIHLPDMTNVNYWILRFLPFLSLPVHDRERWFASTKIQKLISHADTKGCEKRESYLGVTNRSIWKFQGKNVVVALTNRSGVEDLTTIYAGSSGFLKFNGKQITNDNSNQPDSTNASVELLGNLGKGQEGVIMRTLNFHINR